jgi:DNA-binding XRE family transcriptional regulator
VTGQLGDWVTAIAGHSSFCILQSAICLLQSAVGVARKVVRRRAAGLTQADVARRAGIRPETLDRIERPKTTPDMATLAKIDRALGAAEGPGRHRDAVAVPGGPDYAAWSLRR